MAPGPTRASRAPLPRAGGRRGRAPPPRRRHGSRRRYNLHPLRAARGLCAPQEAACGQSDSHNAVGVRRSTSWLGGLHPLARHCGRRVSPPRPAPLLSSCSALEDLPLAPACAECRRRTRCDGLALSPPATLHRQAARAALLRWRVEGGSGGAKRPVAHEQLLGGARRGRGGGGGEHRP